MNYTILRPSFKLTLEEFREALRVFPNASEAGEYYKYDELTGTPVRESGIGDVFLIGCDNQMANLHLDSNNGHISVSNLTAEMCRDFCKVLEAAIRPVHFHGPKAPLPDFIFDYSNSK